MAIDSLTPFPSPPLLGQDQATFNTNASNTLSSMDTFVTELNTSFGQFDIAKTEVETSESNASTSESNALTSENTATTKALEASNSATAALNAQTAAEAIYDTFDDMYLGVKETEPTLDNDGDALKNGAVYIKEVVDSPNQMFVYDLAQTIWVDMSYVPTSFNGLNEINLGVLSDRDTIIYDEATGKWTNIQFAVTETPILSGVNEIQESGNLVVTITNYANFSADTIFTEITTSGTADRVGDTITVTAGSVSSTEAHTLTVTAKEPSHSLSESVHNFDVTDAPFIPDTDAYIDVTGTGFNDTNFPTVTNGVIDTIVGDEGLRATADNAIFQSATVTKSDTEGDWNGTQADSFVTSSLPNVLNSVVYGDTDSVPVMTADVDQGYTVSASTVNGVDAAYVAVDSNVTTNQWTTNAVTTGWWKVQLDATKVFDKIVMMGNTGTPARSPKDFTIEGSDTGAFSGEETILSTVVNSSGWSALEYRTFEFTNSTSFLYYRINITANDGDGTYLTIADIQFMERVGDIILEGEVLATDELYLGDGTDFETVTATGATYLDPSDTNPFGDGNLIRKYMMDGNANDATSNANGIETNVSYSAGVYGQKVDLTGTNSYITVSSQSGITDSKNWTISTIVNFTSLATEHQYVLNCGNINCNLKTLYSNLRISFWDGSVEQLAGVDIEINTTYKVTATYNGSNLILYVDNIPYSSSVTSTPASQSNSMRIGAHGADASGDMFGSVDQVEIYNRALTVSEVQDLYNIGKTKLTHNQSFTPTFACNKDNVSMDVSFDGTNYNTLTKSSAVADSAMVVADTANDEFETVLYTGNGSTQTVSMSNITGGVDFVWCKSRSIVGDHTLFDTVRGIDNVLVSNLTNADVSVANYLTSVTASSFSVGSSIGINANAANYVAWCASLPTKSGVLGNTDGSIASTTMSNSFMSTVSWTGTGANATVGHGLSVAPRLTIIKNRIDVVGWYVNSPILDTAAGENLVLNTSAGKDTGNATLFNSLDPTDSVINLGSNNATNGADDIIAYCFTSVEGLCKVGSYTGTGATGNEVDCGFEPAWVMTKRTNLGGDGIGNWSIFDNQRMSTTSVADRLEADTSDAEDDTSNNIIEFTSNGFGLLTGGENTNGGSGTYIYLAIAKNTPEDLRIKELHAEYQETTNTGTDLAFKVSHKEQDTKTTAVYAALYEGA